MRAVVRAAACGLLLATSVQAGSADAGFLQRDLKAKPTPDTQLMEDQSMEAAVDQRVNSSIDEYTSYVQMSQSQANAAAEEAQAAEARVEAMDVKTQILKADAKNAEGEAEVTVAEAEADLKRAEGTIKAAQEWGAKDAIDKTKAAAQAGAQALFTNKYAMLDTWRKQVLGNHWEDARYASVKAMEPYQHAMETETAKATDYEASAKALQDASAVLKDEAGAVSAAAGEMRMGGDLHGARETGEVAKSIRAHSQALKSYAESVSSEAKKLSAQAPIYLTDGMMAATRARYDANPEALPPLPMDPGFSYIPPASF